MEAPPVAEGRNLTTSRALSRPFRLRILLARLHRASQPRQRPPSSRAWDVQIPHPSRQGFHPTARQIAPLRRFWALCEERIILASALMAHLRKRINAQRLRLSTCKTGALPLSYGPMLTYA